VHDCVYTRGAPKALIIDSVV